MAVSRKQALKQLLGWAEQVESHLAIITANPNDPALNHHQHELGTWLRDMEEVLRHVGKKTAAEWKTRILAYRASLDA